MLFNEFLPEAETFHSLLSGRRLLVEGIIADFITAFPDIEFEMRLDRRIVNAQAITVTGLRRVLLYGGLALHPRLGSNALTFALLHETGHHLAGGNRSPYNGRLACECEADYWAATEGLLVLFQKSGRLLQIKEAMDELRHVMDSSQEAEGTRNHEKRACNCWNSRWHRRRRALLAQIQPPNGPKCSLGF